MKTQSLLAVLAGGLMVGGAQGAVLQTHAGGTESNSGAGTTIIDTTNDTGDWIDGFGDTSDATLYYGFDFTVDANAGETGAGGYFAALQLREAGGDRLGVGNHWFGTNLSTFGHGADNELTATPYIVGTTYRYVVQIDFDSAGGDTATVWINPVTSGSASTNLGVADAGFDSVAIRSGNAGGTTTYANIIFATTFDEASLVPEPGSLALLGLGGLALLRRRRA